MTNFSNQK